MVSVGQESGRSLAGWFWLRVSCEATKYQGELLPSEPLTGPTSKKALTHMLVGKRLQFLIVWMSWGGASPRAAHDMAADFPQN